MFEGRFLQTGGQPGDAQGAYGADGLRPLGWDEIVAMLGAARDFRRVVRDRGDLDGGSFDGHSAAHLATLEEGQRGINPFALTNRKMGHGMDNAAGSETNAGNRGSQ